MNIVMQEDEKDKEKQGEPAHVERLFSRAARSSWPVRSMTSWRSARSHMMALAEESDA
ncbi:MAG: hypothetical protein R3D32_03470 [Nitratireductor sp.]